MEIVYGKDHTNSPKYQHKEIYPLFILMNTTFIATTVVALGHFAPKLQWTRNYKDKPYIKLNKYFN